MEKRNPSWTQIKKLGQSTSHIKIEKTKLSIFNIPVLTPTDQYFYDIILAINSLD